MVLFREIIDVWGVVLVVDATFSPISINVRELIDSESMFFVERGAVEGFGSCDRLLWGFELDERITINLRSTLVLGMGLVHTLLSFPRRLKAYM